MASTAEKPPQKKVETFPTTIQTNQHGLSKKKEEDKKKNHKDFEDESNVLEKRDSSRGKAKEKVDDSVSLNQLVKQKGWKRKRSKKTTVQPPPKSTHEQAEEFCEKIDRRDTETATKKGLTLAEWDKQQLKKEKAAKMAKSDRIITIKDSIFVEPIVESSNSLIVEHEVADEVTAKMASEPEPTNKEVMVGTTSKPEPTGEELMAEKVSEPELMPKKRRLRNLIEKKKKMSKKVSGPTKQSKAISDRE